MCEIQRIHAPRTLCSFLLEESSPLFREHWQAWSEDKLAARQQATPQALPNALPSLLLKCSAACYSSCVMLETGASVCLFAYFKNFRTQLLEATYCCLRVCRLCVSVCMPICTIMSSFFLVAQTSSWSLWWSCWSQPLDFASLINAW